MFKDYADVVSVEEMCKMLRIGRNTAYSMLHDGVIKSYRNGKIYIIPKQSIINFVSDICS